VIIQDQGLKQDIGLVRNGKLLTRFKGIKMIKLKKLLFEEPRVPRKKGQPAKSKKHSDLYTDEDPKGTIHGLKFATVKDAKASVNKIKNSGRSHAHKIQAAVAMEQRAREMGKTAQAAVYRTFINKMKKITKQRNEGWSQKYKKSIDCNNPKGFSQKAHCAGKKKRVTEGKVDQQFNKIIRTLRTTLRRLNDDDSYELSVKLKKWFNKNVL